MHIVMGLLLFLVGGIFVVRFWLQTQWFASTLMFFMTWPVIWCLIGWFVGSQMPNEAAHAGGGLFLSLTVVSGVAAFLIAKAPLWYSRAAETMK